MTIRSTFVGALAAMTIVLTALNPYATVKARGNGRSVSAASSRGLHFHGPSIDVHLLEQLRRFQQAPTPHSSKPPPTYLVPVIVTSTVDVSAAIQAFGGVVEADVNGRILVARIPAKNVLPLARRPGIESLSSSHRSQPTLDRSVPEIGAPRVWSLTAPTGLPIQGQHVLVGIVDTGIDYHNADFKNPDGSSRIKYIWDETASGRPPAGFSTGYECDGVSVDAGTCPERDTFGHGTHVAGIAVGNGLSSDPATQIGVAPLADIIVAKTDLSDEQLIAAWKYMADKANRLHEPLVINNSWGSNLSVRDGSDVLDRAVAELSRPGRIFVMAAGNSSHLSVHAAGAIVPGSTSSIGFNAAPQHEKMPNGDKLEMNLYYPSRANFTASLTNLDTGQSWGPVSQGDTSHYVDGQATRDGKSKVSLSVGEANAGHHEISLSIQTRDGSDNHGQYRLDLQASGSSVLATFDAYLLPAESGSFLDHIDDYGTINAPADSPDAIAVGNYITRTSWRARDGREYRRCGDSECSPKSDLQLGAIDPNSSWGPTADGRLKPDISAPGTEIESSLTHDIPQCSSSVTQSCVPLNVVSPNGQDLYDSGTSMASPHVAGVVALMLQVRPSLDVQGALSALRSSARHDASTGTQPWTPAFGSGKVDALAAVRAIPAERHEDTPTASPTETPSPTVTQTSTSTPTETPTPTPSPTDIPNDSSPTPTMKRSGTCKKGMNHHKGKCRKVKKP